MAEVLQKRSWEERLMTVDMTPSLKDSGATIASVNDVTVTAISSGSPTAVTVTANSTTYTDKKVSFVLEAGQADKDYQVRVRVTTDDTTLKEQMLEGVVLLQVRDPVPEA